MEFELYLKQEKEWPKEGKHILAQYDSESVIVYQAYKSSIGLYAVEHQHFGGDFSFSRMSWIKPNFLWMMYRSGWGTKEGQEITLAIKLKKTYFDDVLRNAYPSTNFHGLPNDEWKSNVASTDVRLQWDPDHKPDGSSETRRAIQLGLRNEFLKPFSGQGIISITNMSPFVEEQRQLVIENKLDNLILPKERVYSVEGDVGKKLGM